MTLQTSLNCIQDADRAALSVHWTDIFDRPPPPNLSQPLMRMILSFERQATTHGGLDRTTKRAILRVQKQNLASSGKGTIRPARQPAHGARLIREWNGMTHVVERTTNGYQWDGQTFKSLSAVASAITGTRWSGPRFFGLKDVAQ